MQDTGCNYDPKEWRLFLTPVKFDSSKVSLKALLLHNDNEKSSIPAAYATGLKETYESMELLLKLIKFMQGAHMESM